ncbi:MAG: PDZ domain-containing protein [Flavobacteriales bacterium]|nr:PDZ domain-containing protein [Flavobacteriales bacterium]
MKNIKRKLIVLVAVLGIGSASFLSLGFSENYFEVSKNLEIFVTLFKELNIYYVDEANPGDLIKKAIDSMLESLDPYTNFIPESEMEDYRFMTTGQYGGIGAVIRKDGDYVVIAEPYETFPAHKAGLKAGDKIVDIDGKPAKGKDTQDVSKVLKGEPGTTVNIRIERPGEKKLLDIQLVREEIKINSVPYYGMLDNEVGYIKLNGFTRNAAGEVKDALLALKDQNATSIVFDLRGNPGGLLNEAIDIVNIFVDKGQLVVSTKGKVKEWEKEYRALNLPVDTEIPVAVLVSRGSASASEIVSGTLQDLDRGVVIGQRTFGKGLVQTTRPLTYNTQLKVTTAKYYIPSGRCIQALDYSNRNEDGSVGKVPDSLMTDFMTANGRTVKDGGGVLPDIQMTPEPISKIAASLYGKLHIFNFITDYIIEHPEVANNTNYDIDDAAYEEFIAYLKGKDYDYTTQSESLLDDLKEAAEQEKYFDSFESEYLALKEKMMHDKTTDLKTYKEQIVELLELELSNRFGYQKGKIKKSLTMDKEVLKAQEVLKDQVQYKALLTVASAENTVEPKN